MQLQLKRLRKLAGYKTQGELAQKIGVKERTYASWEREEVAMSFPQAIACAEILGCTTDELAGRSPSRTFTDPRQEAVNASFDNMNERGKDTLCSVARSMERDAVNRIVKDRDEYIGDTPAMGA